MNDEKKESKKKIFRNKKFKKSDVGEILKNEKEDLDFSDTQFKDLIDNLDKGFTEILSDKKEEIQKNHEKKEEEVKTAEQTNNELQAETQSKTQDTKTNNITKSDKKLSKFKRIKHRKNKKSKKNDSDDRNTN